MTKTARRHTLLNSEHTSSPVSGVGPPLNEQLPSQETSFHQKSPDSISVERRLPVIRDLQSLKTLLDSEVEDVSPEVRLTELRQFVQHPPRVKHEASIESTATTSVQSRHEIALPSITTVNESSKDFDFKRDFVVPVSYIRTALTKESSRSLQLGRPYLYDLRQEDLIFLENLNSNIRKIELNRRKESKNECDNWNAENLKNVEQRGSDIVSEIELIAIVDSLEKLTKTGDVIPFHIGWSQIKRLMSSNFSLDTFSKIYEHWICQRLRVGRPLLRPFWPIPPVSDNSPFAVFRSRQTDKMALRRPRRVMPTAGIQKSQGTTADLGNLLSILDLMKSRDRIKLAMSIVDSILFQQLRCETLDSDYVEPTWMLLKARCRRALALNSQTSLSVFGGIPLTGLSVIPTVDLEMILSQCFLSMKINEIEDPSRLNRTLLQCFNSFPTRRVSKLSICSFKLENENQNQEEGVASSPTSPAIESLNLCSFQVSPLYRQQFFVRSFSKNLLLLEKKQMFQDYETLDRHKMYLYDSLCAVENKRIQKRKEAFTQNVLKIKIQDRDDEDTQMGQEDSPLPLKLVEGAVGRVSQALGFKSKDDEDFLLYLKQTLVSAEPEAFESLPPDKSLPHDLNSQIKNQITPNTSNIKNSIRKRKRDPKMPDAVDLPTPLPTPQTIQTSPKMRSSERIKKIQSSRSEFQTPGSCSPMDGQLRKPKNRKTRQTVDKTQTDDTQTINTKFLNKTLGVQLPMSCEILCPSIPGGISNLELRRSLSLWCDQRASSIHRKPQTSQTTPFYPSSQSIETNTPVNSSLHYQNYQKHNEQEIAVSEAAEFSPKKKRRHEFPAAATTESSDYGENLQTGGSGDADLLTSHRVQEAQEFLLAPDVAFPEIFENPFLRESRQEKIL
eukprot:GHVP01040374.1.p1 GENE.GHVP01040374.1~~GHVP01040374.1.p1  ORF type:complete len:897 (+),score=140.16 GHVP01040374.1:144-2834(+)